ncbi:MAG: tRNA (adenosine(37)-N6)-threonylcarbamoyltransferase complex transferase subunit TsaD [bacterium]|nr:tRNA (adenosine(37)-N6)-threonylcarbamoyltransferase complex transferase subunit TsaD [bacterium]
MLILGIETSCDDTGISVIRVSEKKRPVFEILSNVVSSQIKTHAPFGGVVPNLAAREHLKNIEPCLKTALKEANVKMHETRLPARQVDLVAVTYGPGLIPSLLIGVNFAKALAYKYKKPIIGINHIEAHIVAAFSGENSKFEIRNSKFPIIALVVSGGHTQLVLVKKIGNYKIIGETRDDAAGECFDKVAKLLNLGYPGGPAISREAEKWKSQFSISNFQLPRPMISHKNYDFSFSGLKTAVLYLVEKLAVRSSRKNKPRISNLEPNIVSELCHEAQQAIIDVLILKTINAAKEYQAKTIILAGGVAANSELRKQFELKMKNEKLKTDFLVPPMSLCTDNGAMIAIAAYFNRKKIKSSNWKTIKADANLRLS